jgi:hypothetical protein
MAPFARLSAALAVALPPVLALAQEPAEPVSGYRWVWLAALVAILVATIALFFRAPRRGPPRPPPARRASGA